MKKLTYILLTICFFVVIANSQIRKSKTQVSSGISTSPPQKPKSSELDNSWEKLPNPFGNSTELYVNDKFITVTASSKSVFLVIRRVASDGEVKLYTTLECSNPKRIKITVESAVEIGRVTRTTNRNADGSDNGILTYYEDKLEREFPGNFCPVMVREANARNPNSPVLDLLSTSDTKSSSAFVTIVGQVQNISDESLEGVEAVVTVYDKNGKVIQVKESFLVFTTLAPNQKSVFKVILPFDPMMKKYEVTFKTIRGEQINSKPLASGEMITFKSFY